MRSCGLHRKGGRRSPELSARVAMQLGVDLQTHRSVVVTDLDPSGTLLLGFEPHHLRAWAGSAVKEAGHGLLGAFDPDPSAPLLIPDPYGRETQYVRSVFIRVLACVDSLAQRLIQVGESEWSLRT